jgi:superfamily II DNA/RNA helicase
LNFAELQLSPPLMAAVEKLGFKEATPVQAATMPHIFEGRDVAGLAQTGTGKTAAFLLPIMERILNGRALAAADLPAEDRERLSKRAFADWRSNQFVLILVPTRELAEQVYENAKTLRGDAPLRAVSIYGGVAYDKQKQALRDGIDIIVATPGRLIDLYKENLVDMKNVRAIVFDEADRMFDMGFKDDMKYILQRVPKERQFLVFSATLNMEVLSVAYQFGANPVEVDVSRDQAKAENVVDKIFHIGQDEKPAYLVSLLKKHKPRQTIVFSNFKMNVPRVAQFLNDNGIPAAGISSLLTQAQRNRVMEQFKADNDSNVLVATDVAARGLDIKGVDMVVNFELPDDPENYVHRIGRTGRAGANGLAFSFISDRDVDALARVEVYLKHKVPTDWLDEADLVKDLKPMMSDYEMRRSHRGPADKAGGPSGGGSGGGRNDRGPRRSGGGGNAGRPPERGARPPRQGEDRGPRVEGRGDRGPRPSREGGRDQHRDKTLGRHRGAGEEQQSGGRPAAGGNERRPQGPRPQAGGGQPGRSRAEGGGPRPRVPGQPIANGNGGRHANQNRRPQRDFSKDGRNSSGSRGGPTPVKPPSVGIGQKVSGFFKRLFK